MMNTNFKRKFGIIRGPIRLMKKKQSIKNNDIK